MFLYFRMDNFKRRECKRVQDIVSCLPPLDSNIPLINKGKSWPGVLTNLLTKCVSSIDGGKMLEILDKQATPFVSYLWHSTACPWCLDSLYITLLESLFKCLIDLNQYKIKMKTTCIIELNFSFNIYWKLLFCMSKKSWLII